MSRPAYFGQGLPSAACASLMPPRRVSTIGSPSLGVSSHSESRSLALSTPRWSGVFPYGVCCPASCW